MSMFKEVADIKTSDQLHLPVPVAKFETVVAKPSEIQKEMVQERLKLNFIAMMIWRKSWIYFQDKENMHPEKLPVTGFLVERGTSEQ